MNSTDSTLDDLTLLQRIAAGDGAAFDLFVRRMEKLVFGTVYRVLNDVQDSQDVCQEVFLQVWQKARLFNEKLGRPTTWTATLARNRAIDRVRQKQRQSRLANDYEEKMRPDDVEKTDSWDLLNAKERGREVRSAVMELSPGQREAISLAYFEGLTQAEIASRLNQPLGTVKARIRRGLVKLRERVVPALEPDAEAH